MRENERDDYAGDWDRNEDVQFPASTNEYWPLNSVNSLSRTIKESDSSSFNNNVGRSNNEQYESMACSLCPVGSMFQ